MKSRIESPSHTEFRQLVMDASRPLRSSPDWSLTMPSAQKLDTHHKALTLNLDTSTFGSFAEIGAGQEVARRFLLVGGASGTVAKTISAYDKEVSDDLYGSGSRYVSKQRLEAMLDNEWTQLVTQLSKSRGSQTRFFCFVDTVSPVTSPEPTTHTVGSVSAFSCSPAVLPTTSFCTSICAILPMSSSVRSTALRRIDLHSVRILAVRLQL